MTEIQWRAEGAGRPRKIALALQGGGTHGAFVWGVLDRLLEEDGLEIVGVTGASAGAMNAVVLADGLLRGGPDHARLALRDFWEEVGRAPGFGGLMAAFSGEVQSLMPLERMPAFLAWDFVTRNVAAKALNPIGFNPMRDVLVDLVDFERLRARTDFPVMVSATNVLTGRRRVFANKDLSVDAVLASACAPQLSPAVEIEGESYWDGRFCANPALAEFVDRLPNCDLVITRIDPVTRTALPGTPREIQDRAMELSFNNAFWMELSALGVLLRLADDGLVEREQFGRIFFHAIEASPELEPVAASTRLNNSPDFLTYLFELGRRNGGEWLAANRGALGERSTLDLQALLPVSYEGFRRSEPAAAAPPEPEPEPDPVEFTHQRIRLHSPEYG
jgi:NTE family protein